MLHRRQFLHRAALGSVTALVPGAVAATADPRIIPSPHSVEWLDGEMSLTDAFLVHDGSPKAMLAAQLLQEEGRRRLGRNLLSGKGMRICLVDWSVASDLRRDMASLLDQEDERVLADTRRTGQAYILRTAPERRAVLLAGSGPMGVLYAATTFLQTYSSSDGRLSVPLMHIRDYPDFPNRVASDWLIFAEISHWAYDWGDGKCAYVRRVKRKLDFCLKHKINTVAFDGFGWNSERFPGYGFMMRELNRYARERGIKLLYGGMGTSAVREDHNTANVWLNREAYPSGNVYSCMGSTFGTCRNNSALNRLKADEMETFIRTVEPGGLYIHHEDLQVEPGGSFEKNWKKRCARCRERWPNDEVAAADGAAGAVAHGYKNLLAAVRKVGGGESGYDAARDCEVVFVAPGYHPAPLVRDGNWYGSTRKQDWDRLLGYWSKVLTQMPNDPYFSIGFRETFPQQETELRFVDAYRRHMESRNLNSRMFLFFLGGADLYINNYPFVPTSALDAVFLGADSIYNFNGGLHQEPQQLLNAEFGWNATALGFINPRTASGVRAHYDALKFNNEAPAEIFGPGGFLERACQRLYGRQAGAAMTKFFTLYEEQPVLQGQTLVPTRLKGGSERAYFPEKLYPLAVLGLMLPTMDAKSWDLPISDVGARSTFENLKLDEAAWQERLSQGWSIYERVTRRGIELVQSASHAPDLNTEAREDLEYLLKCLRFGEQLAGVISLFHRALAAANHEHRGEFRGWITQAKQKLDDLTGYLQANFAFDTVCPFGGDQGIWLDTIEKLHLKLDALRR